ncbi:MAG: hypothetical protein KBD37_03020 [Burkholderiales bacterium]|nr:hypothetical protein [Burkholderiales bacterium]
MKKILLSLLLCNYAVFADPNQGFIIPTVNNAPAASSGQYNYFFNGKNLKVTLSEFAKNNGLSISFAPDLPLSILNQRIDGRFMVTQIDDLLNKLAKQYGFNWFIYSGTLYITSTTNVTTKLDVAPQDMDGIRDNLTQMGLYVNRFGYSEMPAEDRILITGPREYVKLVSEQISMLNITPANQQFAVYRLKYANAVDMQFTFNNQQIIIPGVATILKGLLQNNQVNSGGANRVSNQVAEAIKNQNSSGNGSSGSGKSDNSASGNLGNNKDQSDTSTASGAGRSYPLVQADARLNTIVIRDKSNNLSIYKSLIDELDVPAPLIQVEVMIIRLDQDKLNQAGINWWVSAAGASVGFGAGNLNTGSISNNLITSFKQVNPGQVIVTSALSFSDSLQYLEQNHFAQTLSKPSLATIDNIPAIVSINKNYFYATSGQNTSNAMNGMQTTQALQITPHVIFDGDTRHIKLSIILDDGSIDQPTASGTPTPPSTTQSEINSQALLKEGQSIVLAGYTKDVVQEDETKVPGLGDLAWIGWLFKNKVNVVHKEVTLYLVTPKIIWDKSTYKLGNYVTVGGHNVNLKDDYQLVESTSASSKK